MSEVSPVRVRFSRGRGDGHRNRNSRGAATEVEQRLLTSNELETQVSKLSLYPPPMKFSEPKLDEIILNIDMSRFDRLSEASRNLRLTLIKCCRVKRYDIIPLKLLGKLLRKTERDIPSLILKAQAQAPQEKLEVCVYSVKGPTLFHLQLTKQKDRFFAITHFLTDMITNNKIRKFNHATYSHNELVGKIVTAPRFKDNIFARAVIRGFCDGSGSNDGNRARVYFIDYGNEDDFEMERLYDCPLEVAQALPLCFAARLAGLENYCNSSDDADQIQEDYRMFQQYLPNYDFDECLQLHCSILNFGYMDSDLHEVIYDVRLWTGDLDIGAQVEKKMKERKELNEKCDLRQRGPTPVEIGQLLFLDCEVNVRDFEDAYGFVKQCRISFIVSPGEFYVSLVGVGHQWYDDMQLVYKDPVLRRSFRIKTTRVFQSRCYAWYDNLDRSWNRVRVVNPLLESPDGKNTLLWALDRGCYVEANRENLMELDPEFTCHPAMSFRAHLVHVKPKQLVNTGEWKWNVEATDFFKAVSCDGDKVFDYTTIDKIALGTWDSISKYYFVHRLSHGLILTEKRSNVGTVQSALVKAGQAIPSGPGSGNHDLITTCLKSIDGSFMYNQNEIRRELKIYGNKVNAVTKESMQGERNKFKIESLNRRARLTTGARHDFAFTGYPELFRASSNHIPVSLQFSMGYIAFSSTGSGPGNFCIQMQNKMAELNMLTQDLEMWAEKEPCLHLDEISVGMFAIANPIEGEKKDFYGRVVIVSVNLFLKQAVALFVDYGFESLVKLNAIWMLPECLFRTPPFCHRAHLDFTTSQSPFVPSEVDSWSPMVELAWNNCVTRWQDWKPIYYAWEVHPRENLIQLDEFNQPVNFDRDSLKWHAGPLSSKPSNYAALNQFKDHPLLKQFYYSIGITIEVEMKRTSDSPFHFKPIWQTLMDLNHVVPLVSTDAD